MTLSRQQKKILGCVEAHVSQFGFPPTIREIGDQVGLSSSSTVHSHLRSLQQKGYIRRDPSKPRSISILGTSNRPPIHLALLSRWVNSASPDSALLEETQAYLASRGHQ